jgi:hypothetical protein
MEVADPDAPNRTLFNHCLQTLPCRSTSIGSVESSSVLARMMYQYRIQVIQSEPCQRASRPLFHFNHAARISFEAGRDLVRDVNLLTGYRGRSNRFADSFLVHIYWSSVDPAIACRQFTLEELIVDHAEDYYCATGEFIQIEDFGGVVLIFAGFSTVLQSRHMPVNCRELPETIYAIFCQRRIYYCFFQ